MTEAQIRLVESTGKPQPRLAISSDIDGVITEVGVRDGMAVAPGMTLFKIADLSTVWVLAEIPESQASAIRPGQAVTATATAIAGHALTGKVDAILPDVNANTRTVKVRVELRTGTAASCPACSPTCGLARKPARTSCWSPRRR